MAQIDGIVQIIHVDQEWFDKLDSYLPVSCKWADDALLREQKTANLIAWFPGHKVAFLKSNRSVIEQGVNHE